TEGLATSATGPVYLAAQRLLETGLIEESENRPAPEFDDQRRRYYRLTDLGKRVARAEVDRMARLVQVAFDRGLARGSLTIVSPTD
ncbi:MAG: PadR family transcriptional regulator, partial [Gemmatimonadota bacterium]|nr:PadR family transcriptional regulator [Gemmatimonadota bacterium]